MSATPFLDSNGPAAVHMPSTGSAGAQVISLFADAGPEVARPNTQPLAFRRGTMIYMQGDAASHVYELRSGAILLYRDLADGRRQIVELLRPGDFFGLTDAASYDCFAEALSDATVLRLARGDVERSADCQRRLVRQLLRRTRDWHGHATMLGRKTALERVAGFVLALAEDGRTVVPVGLTREQIADYLGLTLETVSRAISELCRRGLIAKVGQSEIALRDRAALAEIADQ